MSGLQKPSSTRRRRFYHYTFEIRKGNTTINRHTLLVNPEDMSQDEPSRSTPVQTLGGAYVLDFGQGLFDVSMVVMTGYKARHNEEGKLTDGYEELKNFRGSIYRHYVKENSPDITMYWYNWEDEEYYQIQPKSFRLTRSKSEPILYRFTFSFTCLKDVKTGHAIGAMDLITEITTRIHEIQNDLLSSVSGVSRSMAKL